MNQHIDPADLSSLLRLLYVGVTDPARTGEFLARCCEHIQADCGAVALRERPTGTWRYIDFYPNLPEAMARYEAQYAADDPMARELLKHPPRRFYARAELLGAEEIHSHPYFTEWNATLGYDEMCGTRVPLDEQYDCYLSFLRRTGADPFGRDELDLLDLLLPHLEQAMAIYAQIGRLMILSDLAQEHLAQFGTGLAILNEEGRIDLLDRVAERILDDAVFLPRADGAIRFADAALQERFEALVASCITLSRLSGVMPGGVLSAPRPDAPPIGLMVLPYRNQAGLKSVIVQRSRAAVVLYDPNTPRLEPPAILRQLYGLSDPEVQVCWRLANGESIEEIARVHGVSRETVRSQLKRIFVKTGTNRQLELMRIVLLGPALWAHVPTMMGIVADLGS